MRLNELFEGGKDIVAISFGRFNPPHKGHRAAWELMAKAGDWYVGTNSSTQGPKDPLPYDVKIEAMKAIYPSLDGHLIATTSWLTMASELYKKYKDAKLLVFTDEDWVTKTIQQYNGQENTHGFYNFSEIEQQPTPRLSSATALRDAVKAGDRKAFSDAAGIDADTKIDGKAYFDLVAEYLMPYAEKEKAKAAKKKKVGEDVVAYDPNGYWDVYLWGNWYRGKHFDYGPRKVAVPGTTESEAMEWIQNHADDIYEYYYKKKFHNGKRMLPQPVEKNLFLNKTKPIGPSQSYRVPPTEGVIEGADERKQNALWAQITAHEKAAKKSKDLKQQHHLKMASQLRSQLKTSDNESVSEAPIEMDPAEPMNPMIYGHNKANPGKLKYRMLRAAGQLKDLAARAENASPAEWQIMARQFEELKMNIEQIRHALEELGKKRKKGGIGSRGIDPMLDSIEEGYGRYWCSTDKKWKTRKGPKQTRKSK